MFLYSFGLTAGKDKEARTAYQKTERFKPSAQTNAIVQAKLAAMDVVDVLLTFQFSIRLEKFIAVFKKLNHKNSTRFSSIFENKKRRDQQLVNHFSFICLFFFGLISL